MIESPLHDEVRELRGELRKSIGGLHAKQNRHHEEVVREIARCGNCRPLVVAHERILRGANGTAGLIDDVRCLKRLKRTVRVWLGLAFGAVVALVAAWLGRH